MIYTRGFYHECSSPNESCQHIGAHGATTSWDVTIGSLFSTIPRGNFVKKPRQLDFNTTYIRTDAKTLKVLLVLLNPPHTERQNLSIVFQEVETIMTAYFNLERPLQGLRSEEHPYRLDVTKLEMSCILKGYHPWFQPHLALANGKSILHPIRNADDTARGGWIVAVGLSSTLPVAYHFMSRDGECESKTKRTPLAHAFRRLLRCLQEVAQAIPGSPLVKSAQDIISWTSSKLIDGSNSTNLLSKFRSGNVQELDGIYG